jgi:acetylornithine/N-succinyldiaminopimelate aminotransferase
VSDSVSDTDELVRRHSAAMMRSVPAPLAILERGEGAWVWDAEGKRYLDFLAGIAVNALGHAHPVVVETLSAQGRQVVHISNYFASRAQIAAAERLLRLTGAGDAGRVFFCNSGAEAIEAAFKLTRLTGRKRVLTLQASFHGRTMGSLSLTGKPALREAFEPLIPGVEHLDSSIAALEAAMGPDVAAVLIEPIKGEAGVIELPDGYVRRARELTTQHGALLILDEIQTGAGRTGDWFAFQHEGVVPDAVTLAKGIGGGMPVGALVTFGATSELLGPGQHGSTFGGNPLATAMVDAVLGEIERAGLVDNARLRGTQIRDGILGLGSSLVSGVRGRGLLLGVALAEPVAAKVSAAALDLGLIVNAANENTIRLAPPLIVGDDEVAAFLEIFPRALEAAA